MKTALFLIASLFAGATCKVQAQHPNPNIVYFLVDNLGNGELGCYGGGELRGAETPTIDQFAREGQPDLARLRDCGVDARGTNVF